MIWTLVVIAFLLWLVLVLFFTPRIDYRVTSPLRPDSDEFLRVIQSTCQAAIRPGNRVEILTNGPQFYPAMRDAIRAAQSSINMEAYIFQPGSAADLLIAAIVERASAGVEVRLVLDAIGSSGMRGAPLDRLQRAGCTIHFYQSISLFRLHRMNNRTHRELLILDGRIAFTGGAGVADWWLEPHGGQPGWRDTMARMEGPIVSALQGVFAENWLECTGEILTAPHHWPTPAPAGPTDAMLVKSSPSDRATASRVVFQMLIEGAVRRIDISTPYFLPDHAMRRALVQAARRDVRVRVIVPGRHADQQLVRLASRRLYGELLAAGVSIFEYRPDPSTDADPGFGLDHCRYRYCRNCRDPGPDPGSVHRPTGGRGRSVLDCRPNSPRSTADPHIWSRSSGLPGTAAGSSTPRATRSAGPADTNSPG